MIEKVCPDDDKMDQVGFQRRPNYQIGAVGRAQSVILQSVAEFAYYWIRTEDYLGNVGLLNSIALKLLLMATLRGPRSGLQTV